MNLLTSMFDQLAVSLTADPLLLLASAVTAFDPFWNALDAENIDYDTDPVHIVLQIALALAAKVTFDTGLLGGNTLLVRQDGVKRTVVEYRPPQKTGLFLDGSETALRVPLPKMVMIRVTTEGKSPQYGV